MKLTADKKGTTRYFTARLGRKECFNPREIEILSAGTIPMIIPPLAVQGKKNDTIQYDISPYTTLEFYLNCVISREHFEHVLLEFISLLRKMQKLYLNYNNLVLNMDQVYVQLSDQSLHFIYLPLEESNREMSIPHFFGSLTQRVNKSTHELVVFADGVSSWLKRPVPFTIDEFEAFIRSDKKAAVASAKPAQSPAVRSEKSFYRPSVKLPAGRPPSQDAPVCTGDMFDGTVVLTDTTENPRVPRKRYFLTRSSTNERFEILRTPFILGTGTQSVSYRISDNTAISHKHAEFCIDYGECLVVDQNSTNKTYVNDVALEPFSPQSLADGDRIRLADETFIFTMEG